MTREEALHRMAAAGILGADAETALNTALRKHVDIDEMLEHAKQFSNKDVFHLYGQDAGRAVLVLRAE